MPCCTNSPHTHVLHASYPTYTHVCMLVSPCLPPKVAKNIKLHGIRWSLRAMEGFLTILPLVAHPQTE
jgi:hypothetical protein